MTHKILHLVNPTYQIIKHNPGEIQAAPKHPAMHHHHLTVVDLSSSIIAVSLEAVPILHLPQVF
jgi:hypothetical protein